MATQNHKLSLHAISGTLIRGIRYAAMHPPIDIMGSTGSLRQAWQPNVS